MPAAGLPERTKRLRNAGGTAMTNATAMETMADGQGCPGFAG